MKNFILCTCFLIALPLFAGKRVQTETIDLQTKATQPQEMLLDATRFRSNNATTSVLFLTDGGRSRIVTLDKVKNEYIEMDQRTLDQMGQAVQGMAAQMEAAMKGMPPEQRAMMEQMMKGKMPQAVPPAPVTTYTAKGRGSVNGFACTNYDGMRAGQKFAEVCAAQPADLNLAASDYQVFQKMQEFAAGFLRAIQNSPMASMASVVGPNLGAAGYDGFPVQNTTFVNGQATKQEVLKSITNATFTDADFSLGNAKKTEMPDLSGLGAPGKGRTK